MIKVHRLKNLELTRRNFREVVDSVFAEYGFSNEGKARAKIGVFVFYRLRDMKIDSVFFDDGGDKFYDLASSFYPNKQNFDAFVFCDGLPEKLEKMIFNELTGLK